MPATLVYAGSGFSEGVLHFLKSSEDAAYCLPTESLAPEARRGQGTIDTGTWQLDHILAMSFGWWDVIVGNKSPISLQAQNSR